MCVRVEQNTEISDRRDNKIKVKTKKIKTHTQQKNSNNGKIKQSKTKQKTKILPFPGVHPEINTGSLNFFNEK